MSVESSGKNRGQGSLALLLRGLGVGFGLVGFITLLILWLAGVFQPKVSNEPGSFSDSLAKISAEMKTVEVELKKLPRLESAVGTIRAVHEVGIASKILARVDQITVKAGQRVKRDEVIAVLDEADLLARLKQAEAAQQAAAARLDQARIDMDRGQKLRDRQAISREELDKINTELRTAQAEFERSQQAAREAKIMENYATIKAPIEGIIVDKRVNVGDTVQPGQVLASMYDPQRMQMVATVRESLAQRLGVGQEVPARIDTLDLDCHATVSEIVPEAQAESRSFQVKVTGPCPPDIISGMFGRIYIPLEEESVIVIPPNAVRRVGQLSQVEVVDDQGLISKRVIQTGRQLSEGLEVLSGLSAGQRLVVSNDDQKSGVDH